MTQPDAPNKAAYDFRHAAMHRLADWPVLAQIVAARKSDARRLDSRMVAALYADAAKDEWAEINAHPAHPA